MRIIFLGDICLSRSLRRKYVQKPYKIVSEEVKRFISGSDLVVGNLESPILVDQKQGIDHLLFYGLPSMLNEFNFVNLFSLSNNHINDFGEDGVSETMYWLNKYDYSYNGVYSSQYEAYLYGAKEKIAIITCTDMMNVSMLNNNKYKVLYIDSKELDNEIEHCKLLGYFVVLYAHVGILFSRYVNPPIRDLLHDKIKKGVDVVVTVHPHCVGGMEYYDEKPIFYSLGDFSMDGESYRRRRSVVLCLDIMNGGFQKYELFPVVVDDNYQTVSPPKKVAKRVLNDWNKVSQTIKKRSNNYKLFFNSQYKKEIIMHSLSTLFFIYKKRGMVSLLKLVSMRIEEVIRMLTSLFKNKSVERRDDDAILETRKNISEEKLYK